MRLPIKEGHFHEPESGHDKPYLIGSRCRVCGYVCFPKKDVCVRCLRDDTMEETHFGPDGVLESFAVMQVAPSGFSAPYIQGYVTLKDGPKVFTLMTGCPPDDDALKVGQEMELVIETIRENEKGDELIGWKFRPVKGKGRS